MDIEVKGTEIRPIAYWIGDVEDIRYPAWRYHNVLDPIMVKNTEEDEEAKKKDYGRISPTAMGCTGLTNWVWDIEDMSPKQLVVYAKEEWDIDLPVEADQEHLQKAIFELARWAPNNRGRLTFMAHQIKMNLDEVQQEIRDLTINGMSEVEEKRFEI